MKTIRTSLSLTFALLIGLLAWTGCDSSGDSGATNGKMTLRLTDAPVDSATAVNVTIRKISLVPGDDGDDDGDDGDADGEDDFVTVYEPDTPQTINLLEFQSTSTTLAEEVDVPEGEYSQMRLFLTDDNTITFESGETVDLTTPSAQESGYKINIPGFEIDDNSDRIAITLDFDASESVVKAGQSGQFLLKPVVRPSDVQFNDGSIEEAELEATGAIDNLADSTITVETVQFVITPDTEFEDVDGFDGLTSFSYASVEGTDAGDSFEATYVEALENEDKRFSYTGALDDLTVGSDTTITMYGTDIAVTADTELEDDLSLAGLQPGNFYDVEFTKDGSGARFADEIEAEDD
jgi:hypothetical protein